jgi:hypothetical protein
MSPGGADLVLAMRRLVHDFGQRRLTYDDFLAVCAREGIDHHEHDVGPDERLLRGDLRPRISLRRGLAPRYRTFVAWHALGHYVLHPGPSTYYFERGWLDAVEAEASTVGYLALAPWPAGPPYPELRGVRCDEAQLVFHVAYPDQLDEDGFTQGWRVFRTVLTRTIDTHGVTR